MRSWKNWLLSILTCLAVLAAAVLPPRMSALQDGLLVNAVHTEELGEERNFPLRSLELGDRIRLLAQFNENSSQVPSVDQRLDDEMAQDATALATQELRRLAQLSILPPSLLDIPGLLERESIQTYDAYRLYLQDQDGVGQASYLVITLYYDTYGVYPEPNSWLQVEMALDGESGKALFLQADFSEKFGFPAQIDALNESEKLHMTRPADIAMSFLEHLTDTGEELSYELRVADKYDAVFRLDAVQVGYVIYLDPIYLSIAPYPYSRFGYTDDLPGLEVDAGANSSLRK